jgi:hypothetical protein
MAAIPEPNSIIPGERRGEKRPVLLASLRVSLYDKPE